MTSQRGKSGSGSGSGSGRDIMDVFRSDAAMEAFGVQRSSRERGKSVLGECPTCAGSHTVGSGHPNGVDCRCGRHFHFGDDLWIRTDESGDRGIA